MLWGWGSLAVVIRKWWFRVTEDVCVALVMASWDFFSGVHKNSDWAFVWGCRAANANVGYGQSHPYFRLAERFWLLHLNPAQFSSQKNPLFIEKSPELTNMFFLFFFFRWDLDDATHKSENACVYFVFKDLSSQHLPLFLSAWAVLASYMDLLAPSGGQMDVDNGQILQPEGKS